jgi:hypothetical protein
MAVYEILFRDKDGQVFEAEEFDSDNDAAAVTEARVLYERSIKHGFMLMRDTRVILNYYPPAEQTSNPAKK